MRQGRAREPGVAPLQHGLGPGEPLDQERAILTEEVKVACTLGLLQFLGRPHDFAQWITSALDPLTRGRY